MPVTVSAVCGERPGRRIPAGAAPADEDALLHPLSSSAFP